jgi:hypothetical protein
MTLRDKFQKWHDSPTNETVAENITELEQIADDYAMEFAHWCEWQDGKAFKTFQELLEIFKKEKGL